jgi:protein O-GlcNAc transferase
MPQVTIEQAIQLALQHHRAGQWGQAESLYRQILAHDPENADALHLLGVMAHDLGRHDVAVDLIRRAVSLRPDFAEAHSNLGNALRGARQFDQAIAAYHEALHLHPDSPELHSSLGQALQSMGKLDEAIASYRTALKLAPNDVDALSSLGTALRMTGRVGEAVAAYREALRCKPDAMGIHSQLLLSLHYDAAYDPAAIYQEHRHWYQRHAESLCGPGRAHANSRDPGRRIRIGYVSPDLCDHVVARFLLPLLSCHDHSQVEVFCYAPVPRPDDMADRLRTYAHHWKSLLGLSDEQAADLIRRDEIDILVDLAGHTPGHSLLVFARKPAPVQVTWLGYPDTTGLPTIDYRLTDAFADPPGLTESLHSEYLVRLPQTAWCFHPVGYTRPVGPLPSIAAGHVTFGTFNNFAKVSQISLELWCRVLQQVPDSHLLLKGSALGSSQVISRLHQFFTERDVASERLDLVPYDPSAMGHLRWYDQMDISLDTFPYHGTTTTCEALWMGVPVVTLTGRTHVSRVGVSLLSNMGLADLVADSPDRYVQIAISLAHDRSRLQEFRSTLRQRMQRSPLMDAPRFARNMEAAYRAMWRTWCSAAVPGARDDHPAGTRD